GLWRPAWGLWRPSCRSDRREVARAVRRAVLDGRALRLPRSVLEGVDLDDDDVVHVFAAVDGVADDVFVFLVVHRRKGGRVPRVQLIVAEVVVVDLDPG